MSRRSIGMGLGFAVLAGSMLLRFGNDGLRGLENSRPSVSLGTPQEGSLENGKRMPSSGVNFRTYSYFGSLIGRTTINSRLRDVVIETYRRVSDADPLTCFVFGEISWPQGGRIRPHVTHRNGLSVDFMVPVRTKDGRRQCVSTYPWNAWGYRRRFDDSGHSQEYDVDFEAIGLHLVTLDQVAKEQGVGIAVVIFESPLQPHLLATKYGDYIRRNIRLSVFKPWVRHDNHYHVDFSFR